MSKNFNASQNHKLMTKHYTIGIDTGGTYTDAVVVNTAQRKILASAKSLTTHGNLSAGIIDALANALQYADCADQQWTV